MTDIDPKKDLQIDEAEKLLPLVLEIMPGHAAEGLIDIFEPGSYEAKSLRKLCNRTLSKKNLTIEEQLIVEDVTRQLEGGKLLCRGQEIEGTALEAAGRGAECGGVPLLRQAWRSRPTLPPPDPRG